MHSPERTSSRARAALSVCALGRGLLETRVVTSTIPRFLRPAPARIRAGLPVLCEFPLSRGLEEVCPLAYKDMSLLLTAGSLESAVASPILDPTGCGKRDEAGALPPVGIRVRFEPAPAGEDWDSPLLRPLASITLILFLSFSTSCSPGQPSVYPCARKSSHLSCILKRVDIGLVALLFLIGAEQRSETSSLYLGDCVSTPRNTSGLRQVFWIRAPVNTNPSYRRRSGHPFSCTHHGFPRPPVVPNKYPSPHFPCGCSSCRLEPSGYLKWR